MHVDPSSECGALLRRHGLVRGKDWVPEKKKCPLKMDGVILAVLRTTRKLAEHRMKKKAKDFSNKQRELDPVVFEAPERGERGQLEIRSDSKTVVDWITSKARQRPVWCVDGSVQRHLRQWFGPDHQFEKKGRRLDGAHIREHDKESVGKQWSWRTTWKVWNCVVLTKKNYVTSGMVVDGLLNFALACG